MLSPSHYLLALPSEDLTVVPTVRAYGDQDDHLRLTVLLADALGKRADSGLRTTCTRPDVPWKARKGALRQLLEEAQKDANKRGEATHVRLVDPDVLDVGDARPSAPWDDATFRRERGELFALLLDRIANGGWELIRPEPRAATTDKLDERDCELIEPTPPLASATLYTPDDERLAAVADRLLLPAIRPLANKLVETGQLRARALARMLEAATTCDGANDAVFEIAYDFLSIDAIEAGKRLSVLRGPQHWNGVAGRFELRNDEVEWTTELEYIQREAAQELVRGGWMQIHVAPDGAARFTMPNAVRGFLQARATTTDAERVRRENDWLARREPSDVGESVEVHYHAVESGDGLLARQTAKHYGADLRRIAYSLGTRKDATAADRAEAARICRVIVHEFDKGDAYAWHYLAYNLARAHGRPPYPPSVEREILDAYAAASRCDPRNPLYKGREVGFWARLGWDVEAHLQAGTERFGRLAGTTGLVIFAQRVLEGMSSAMLRNLAVKPLAGELRRNPALASFFQ